MGIWRRARQVSPLHWFMLMVVTAHVAPVWAFRYFPTQDGPAHVQNAVILRRIIAGEGEITRGYHINRRPVPNWIGHAILAAASTVMSPRMAEKVVVSLYVVGLPLAIAFAARAARHGGDWVALLALPLVYSLALHKGLYNFCLSLVIFFLLLGYAIRHFQSMRPRDVAAMVVLSLLLYFSHIVSLGMAYAVLGGLGIGVIIKRWRQREPIPWNRIGGAAAALMPAMALAIWFFATGQGGGTDRRPVAVQLLRFFELDALAALRKPELLTAIGFSILFWVTIIALLVLKIARRSSNAWDGLLLLALALLIVYLIAPNSAAGGGQLSFRLSLFPYFVLIMWIAAQPIARFHVFALASVAIAAALLFVAIRWDAYRMLNAHLAEYVSVAQAIEPGRSVVAIDGSRESAAAQKTSWRIRPFWHAMGYVAAERELFDFGNYEQKMGYFPVVSPGIWNMGSSRLTDDRVTDDERYAMQSQATYVVVWSIHPEQVTVSASTQAQLRDWYDVVYTSAPRGMATVYRRKQVPAG